MPYKALLSANRLILNEISRQIIPARSLLISGFEFYEEYFSEIKLNAI